MSHAEYGQAEKKLNPTFMKPTLSRNQSKEAIRLENSAGALTGRFGAPTANLTTLNASNINDGNNLHQ